MCGGFYPKNWNGIDLYDNWFAVGVTAKGSAGKCTVMEITGQISSTRFYNVIDTTHIAGCAGPN
jgi:hypothetical protein